MSERSDLDLMQDILEAVRRILGYCAGMDRDAFLSDQKTQDAVVRNVEIVGEAAKGLSAQTRERHAEIPWKDLAKMRDRLIHHYFGVNWDIVWEVVDCDLPALKVRLEHALQS